MAMTFRIEYSGEIYQITNSGICRRKIFNEDKDCNHLIPLFKEAQTFFFVEVIDLLPFFCCRLRKKQGLGGDKRFEDKIEKDRQLKMGNLLRWNIRQMIFQGLFGLQISLMIKKQPVLTERQKNEISNEKNDSISGIMLHLKAQGGVL